MDQKNHSLLTYLLFPGIAMLLGWGLRGYIGGGPYGAMIPGCFVALSLCLLLNYRVETAAMAAVFGAMGIGIGGEMTYGQTLGFVRDMDTVGWGVLGCTVKGGIWGLLGGAILGLGLKRDSYDRKSIILGMVVMVVGFVVGLELINNPKLIYFSNLEDRPRDESWAGLLFSAIGLLAFMRSRGDAAAFQVPLRFAVYGCVGGAIGFGVGCLFLGFGPPIQWIGWWKVMEFFFGLSFGVALGYCAYTLRDTLVVSGQEGETPSRTWAPVLGVVGLIALVFGTYYFFLDLIPESFLESDALLALLTRKSIGVLVSFSFVSAVVISLGLYSQHAAWQAAISLTFFHTVMDYTRDLSDVEKFGYVWPSSLQWLVNIGATVFIGYCSYSAQKAKRPVMKLLLISAWFCYGTACARSFINLNLMDTTDNLSYVSTLISTHPSIIFVHGTFTISALITTWYALKLSKD